MGQLLALLLSATPGLVQQAYGAAEENTSTTYTANFANKTKAANLLVVCLAMNDNSGGTNAASFSTPTDDQSNTWHAGPSIADGSETMQMFYAFNVAANTQKVTAVCSDASNCSVGNGYMHIGEFFNIATASPADGSGNATSSSTTSQTVTTSVSGDLLVSCNHDDNGAASLTSIAFGSGWTGDVAQRFTSPVVEQHKIGGGAGTETCAFTVSGSDTWEQLCQPFKNASAGSDATGPRIVSVGHFQGPVTSITQNLPCRGNLLVLANDSDVPNVTAISDSNGNTWTHALTHAASGVAADMWYAANATCSSAMTLTPTYAATSGEGVHFIVWDVAGMPTSPFDNSAQSSGKSTTSVATNDGVALTPITSQGIIFEHFAISFFDINSLTANAGTAVFDSFFNAHNMNNSGAGSGCTSTPPDFFSEDNGYGHIVFSSSTAYTPTWGNNDPGTCAVKGIQDWSSQALSFTTIFPGTTPTRNLLGVGL